MKKNNLQNLFFLLMTMLLILPKQFNGQQLTYKTSWIANSFPGGDSYSTDPTKAHIQNYIQNFWVDRNATDGKVFTTATWDEGDREKSIIQNGQVIGRMPDPGHNVQHDAITGDGTYIYIAQVIDRGNWVTNGYGLRRYNPDGSAAPMTNGVGNDKSYIQVQPNGAGLDSIATALAVNTSNKELYYADPVDKTIKVIDLNSYTVIASFAMNGIAVDNDRLAVATDGYLWWMVRSDKKVYRYSSRGAQQSQQVTDVQNPAALCIDKNNNLYVADNGISLQVRVYNNINSSPAFARTVGNNGGIYSGSRGAVGDIKFHPGISGLGTDANGNIYLSSNGVDNSTGTILKSINPSGSGLNWQVYGLAFVDCFDVDPATDGLDIYGRTEHFKMDYSKSNGQEWSYKGYTVDQFTNTGDGARGDGTAIIRNRDGRKFMYTIGMTAGGFNLYRFDAAPSEITVPAGSINRDGGWGWDVDSNCDVWSGGAGGKIRRYAYPGINLTYNTGAPDEWNIPAPFNAVERVKYIAASDVLYISGWSDSYPNSKNDWGRIGRIICRYNNWRAGNRTANVTTVLDYTNQEAPKAFDVAGDYAFVTSCKTEMTWVYNLADGSQKGIITPGPEVNSKSGWVDIPYGTRAFKRSTGEYLVLNEEDLFGKVILYRWCPSGNCSVGNIPVTGVSVSPVTDTVNIGGTASLAATISPANASNDTVNWTTSNTAVATVGSNGVVTGVAAGNATITATTRDGNKTATCAFTVKSSGGATQLTGTVFTNVDPYGAGIGNNAFDGNTATFVDAKQTSGAYVGLNLGTAQTLATVNFFPRSGQEARMNGGKFQGSNDSINYTDLYTIGANPPAGWNTVSVTGTYRYVRYINNAANTYCNVAEIQFWGQAPPSNPLVLIKLDFNANTGTSVVNSGSAGGSFTRTTPTPSWSVNTPATIGGASSVDFGTVTGSYVVESASPITQLAGLGSFTVTGWVNCRNATEGAGGNRIVSWINNGGNGVDLVYKTDGSLQMGVNEWADANGGTPPRSSAGKITTDAGAAAGNWRFFAVTYQSGTNTVNYYFGATSADAALDVTRSYNKGAVGSVIGNLAIGHFNVATRGGATDRMFRGLIDRVEIYGSVLSPSQIVSVQRGSSGVSSASIEASAIGNQPAAFSATNGQAIQLSLYPNPAGRSGEEVIVNYMAHDHEKVCVQVTNSEGRIIGQRFLVAQEGMNTGRLDIGRLSSGTYFITLITDSIRTTRKLLIMH